MNNICNYEEGCSLPSSNKYDLLIKQLKREIDELANTTEAKLLCHDGKIAEMCKYIKDNLSNTLRDLIDSMKLSGELDDIITDAVLNEIKLLELKTDYFINVKEFGAIGDGVSDDTCAFKKAIELILSNYRYNKIDKAVLMIPGGKYKITSKLSIYPTELIDDSTHNNLSIKIVGSGRTATQLHFTNTDKDNGLYIKKCHCFIEDLLLIDDNENSIHPLVVLGDETDNGISEVLKQSTFKNVNVCGRPVAIEIRRMYDSSFNDCFFSSIKNNVNKDENSCVIDIKPTLVDNSNNISFVRCHFENSESNSTLLRIKNKENRYHHSITLLNCHFETRNFSTKSFDLEFVERISFYGCQFTRNNYDLANDIYEDIENLISNSRIITFNECLFNGTNNNKNKPYIKLLNNIYTLNIVNTYMYGEVNGLNAYIDYSNVNNYERDKQTWNLDFSKGLVGYNRYNNKLALNIEDGNKRYDFITSTSKNYENNYKEMFIKFNEEALPKEINRDDTEQFSINFLGAITPSIVTCTHDYLLSAGEVKSIDVKMLNNANRVGFYFVFDSEAGSSGHYGILFRAGTHLTLVSGTIQVSDTAPVNYTENTLYCFIKDNKLTVKNNANANRRVMVLPITFK